MDSNNKQSKDEYLKSHGELLLKLARTTIGSRLGIKGDLQHQSEIMEELKDKIFDLNMGTFVTIHLNKKLRGCIGTLESTESVKKGIMQNSISAAFDDPRFPHLTLEEFYKCHLEVSILSKPIKLQYSDSAELLSKLEPGVHGVIIKKEGVRATFLPQVWQQLPDKSTFLSNLCRKAGLHENEWKIGNLEVMIYKVQYFEE